MDKRIWLEYLRLRALEPKALRTTLLEKAQANIVHPKSTTAKADAEFSKSPKVAMNIDATAYTKTKFNTHKRDEPLEICVRTKSGEIIPIEEFFAKEQMAKEQMAKKQTPKKQTRKKQTANKKTAIPKDYRDLPKLKF